MRKELEEFARTCNKDIRIQLSPEDVGILNREIKEIVVNEELPVFIEGEGITISIHTQGAPERAFSTYTIKKHLTAEGSSEQAKL